MHRQKSARRASIIAACAAMMETAQLLNS